MDNLTGFLTVLSVFVFGIVAAFYYFDKERRRRAKEADAADDRLIKLLQETIKELQGKVTVLERWKEVAEERMTALKMENSNLVKILQGRDDNTREYQQKALRAMELVENTNGNVQKLMELMEKHLDIIEKKLVN